jgi:hypothetical protein
VVGRGSMPWQPDSEACGSSCTAHSRICAEFVSLWVARHHQAFMMQLILELSACPPARPLALSSASRPAVLPACLLAYMPACV